MRPSIAFLLCCFVASFVMGVVETDAHGQCDNKCRRRNYFYLCNGSINACVNFTIPTCSQCVYGGGCRIVEDATKGECLDTLDGPTSVPVYNYSPCNNACACPNYQTFVEASDSGSDANPFGAHIKICR